MYFVRLVKYEKIDISKLGAHSFVAVGMGLPMNSFETSNSQKQKEILLHLKFCHQLTF